MANNHTFEPNDASAKSSENSTLTTFDANQYQVASIDQAQNKSIESYDLPALTISSENQINSLFRDADTSQDGILTRKELEQKLESKDLSKEDRAILNELNESFSVIQNLKSDEANHEAGITTDDINEHHKRGLDHDHVEALRPGSEAIKLKEIAGKNLSPEEFEFLKENMEKFESGKANSPKDISETYKHLSRILENRNNTNLSPEQMDNLALDVIYHAANPQTVNQGEAYTCTVASLESRMYSRHPGKAAKLVADAAIKGWYNPPDGSKGVTLDTNSFKDYPDSLAGENLESRYDGSRRTHANQIFQITATNLHYEQTRNGVLRDHDYRSELDEDGNYSERLYNPETGQSTNATGILVFDGEALENLNDAIAGVDEPPFVIDALKARSLDEFNDRIDDIERADNYPALVIVSNGHPEVNGSVTGGVGFHVFAVEKGENDKSLLINDQYGRQRDRMVDKEDLFRYIKIPHFDGLEDSTYEPALKAIEELLSKGELDDATRKKVRLSMNLMTPETFDRIEKLYKEKTGHSLKDKLSDYLDHWDLIYLDADNPFRFNDPDR